MNSTWPASLIQAKYPSDCAILPSSSTYPADRSHSSTTRLVVNGIDPAAVSPRVPRICPTTNEAVIDWVAIRRSRSLRPGFACSLVMFSTAGFRSSKYAKLQPTEAVVIPRSGSANDESTRSRRGRRAIHRCPSL